MATVFLKQYGERRTGTNVLRALTAANFQDVVVLMHILGDKHSPPVPLDDFWRDAQQAANPAFEFVSRATFAVPALTTSADDRRQIAEVRRCAAAVAEAFTSGSFGWIISIRNPYTWAISLARFLGWANRRTWSNDSIDDLRAACRRFNENYKAWFALVEAHPARAVIVRHEDLVHDQERAIEPIEHLLGCKRRGAFRPVDRVVDPAIWDHEAMPMAQLPYDRDYYAGTAILGNLGPAHRDAITDSIDWPRLAPLGYAPAAA